MGPYNVPAFGQPWRSRVGLTNDTIAGKKQPPHHPLWVSVPATSILLAFLSCGSPCDWFFLECFWMIFNGTYLSSDYSIYPWAMWEIKVIILSYIVVSRSQKELETERKSLWVWFQSWYTIWCLSQASEWAPIGFCNSLTSFLWHSKSCYPIVIVVHRMPCFGRKAAATNARLSFKTVFGYHNPDFEGE